MGQKSVYNIITAQQINGVWVSLTWRFQLLRLEKRKCKCKQLLTSLKEVNGL